MDLYSVARSRFQLLLTVRSAGDWKTRGYHSTRPHAGITGIRFGFRPLEQILRSCMSMVHRVFSMVTGLILETLQMP